MTAQLRIANPATGAFLAEVPDRTAEDAAAAVARARAAQPAWGGLSFVARARALRRLSRRLVSDPSLIETLVAESGKPHHEAIGIELFYTAELIRYFTGRAGRRALADDNRRPFVFAYKRCRVIQHPRGVVGVIGPWNWPLLNNFADAVAPLLAGNAVILKPSPLTPLTSLRVLDLWREAGLPPDVLQVLTGGAPAGAALVDQVDMIFFTGSNRAGRAIAKAAADRLIPVVLELGGKSAMIVCADANLPLAAQAAVWSGFAHSGQVCIRTERVLVDEAVHDEFVRLCLREMEGLRQGPPRGVSSAGPDVGAMTFLPQIEHVERQLADALAQGARVASGGRARPDLGGQFFEPTLLVDVTPNMSVAREETFGPLLPIVRVRDAEEALRVANDSTLGLSGSVFSEDRSQALALARRLEVGSVCINDTLKNYFCVESPLGGVKQSGLGFRHGPEALRQFCRTETIVEDRALLGRASPLMQRWLGFPYRPRVLRLLRRVLAWVYG